MTTLGRESDKAKKQRGKMFISLKKKKKTNNNVFRYLDRDLNTRPLTSYTASHVNRR
jgi:hypothetical protein